MSPLGLPHLLAHAMSCIPSLRPRTRSSRQRGVSLAVVRSVLLALPARYDNGACMRDIMSMGALNNVLRLWVRTAPMRGNLHALSLMWTRQKCHL